MGKPSINGQFSMAMLNNQMVTLINNSMFTRTTMANWTSFCHASRVRDESVSYLVGQVLPPLWNGWSEGEDSQFLPASVPWYDLPVCQLFGRVWKWGYIIFRICPKYPQVKGRFDKWHVKICTV
jgi:hypothetical protein